MSNRKCYSYRIFISLDQIMLRLKFNYNITILVDSLILGCFFYNGSHSTFFFQIEVEKQLQKSLPNTLSIFFLLQTSPKNLQSYARNYNPLSNNFVHIKHIFVLVAREEAMNQLGLCLPMILWH